MRSAARAGPSFVARAALGDRPEQRTVDDTSRLAPCPDGERYCSSPELRSNRRSAAYVSGAIAVCSPSAHLCATGSQGAYYDRKIKGKY
jgi:hypothetical protein